MKPCSRIWIYAICQYFFMIASSWLPNSTYLYFSFVFHNKAKRAQQEDLLGRSPILGIILKKKKLVLPFVPTSVLPCAFSTRSDDLPISPPCWTVSSVQPDLQRFIFVTITIIINITFMKCASQKCDSSKTMQCKTCHELIQCHGQAHDQNWKKILLN